MNRTPTSLRDSISKSGSIRWTSSAIAIAFITFGGLSPAFAANKFWTGPSGTTDAPVSGTWDTTSTVWNNGTGTAPNATFPASGDGAFFGGPDGSYLVACTTALGATNITFNASGYTLSNSAATTLSIAANGAVRVAAGKTGTIGTNVLVNGLGNALFFNPGSAAAGTLTVENGGTFRQGVNQPFQIDGGSGSTIQIKAGGHVGITGNGSNIRIGVTAGAAPEVIVDGGVFANRPSGPGIRVGSANGAAGTLTIISGVVSNTGTTAIQLCESAGSTGTVNLNGGLLNVERVVKGSGTAATFNFNGGTVRAINGTAASTFLTGLTSANVRNNASTIDNGGFNITIGQALLHSAIGGDAATDGGLNFAGSGSTRISGANTYNGPTAVNAGKLITTTASTGAGSYTVAGGASLEIQVAGAGQSLAASSLTLASGNVTNTFTLGANGSTTTPAMTVSGVLNLNGTVNVTVTGTGLSGPNTYLLMSYGSISGAGSFVAGSLPAVPGYVATLTNDTTAKQLQLIYTSAPQPVRWAVGDGSWDTTSLNWQLLAGSSATNYVEGAFVALDDSAAGSSPITVTLAGARSPTVISNNSTKSYTITGGFGITGSPALVKNGGGTLNLDNSGANVIANATINSGTLQVGNGGLAGTTVTNNAALAFNPTTSISVGAVSGTGTVTKSNAGTLTLSAAATHSGITTIDGGRLLLAADAANTTISNNVAGGLGFSGLTAVSIGGLAGSGSVALTNAAGAAITLTSGGNNASTEYSGALSGAGGSVLHKAGTGTLTLSGTVSGLNNLTVSSGPGTLAVSGGTVTTTNMQVNVANGIIAISGGTVTVPIDWRISASGGAVNISAGTHHFSKIVIANGSGVAIASTTVSGSAQVLQDSTYANVGGVEIKRQLWVGGNNSATSGFLTLKDNASWINAATDEEDGNANPTVVVGNNGTCAGTFTITNSAAFTYTNLMRVAQSAGNSGTINLDGGAVSLTGFKRGLGTGIINANGGKLVALASTANYFQNFDGAGGANSVNLLAGGLTFDSGSFVVTVPNILSGAGGLTKIGNGTLNLNGVNTYTGTTLVSNGTLGGNGTIAGDLTVAAGGTLGAGTSIGTLTVGGAATLAGTVVAELASGPSADLINFAGGASLGGTLTVTSTDGLVNGQTFNLFDGSLSGNFGTVNLPGGAAHWNTSALYTSGEITLVNNAPVAANFTCGVAVGGSALISVFGKYVTDADVGDVVTITGVSAPVNGTISIIGGTNLLYTSTNSAAGDSFTYTVSDGLSSATATVTVQTYSPEGFNKLSGPTIVGAGPDYSLSYLGVPNEDYALDETSSLTPPITWTPVVTNTASGTGGLEFIFTPVNPSGFFRTRHVP